jgi:endo-1,4-beta-xylanase
MQPNSTLPEEMYNASMQKRILKKTLPHIFRGLLLALLLGGCTSTQQLPPSNTLANPTAPTAEQSLRLYASQRGTLIGTAVAYTPLTQDKLYAQTLAREFSILTPENAMKFDAVHLSENTYDFSQADAIVQFAEQNGMQVRGHTLVWHNQLPQWLTGGNFTHDQLIAILKDHILTVVGHYRGKAAAWDVVNEAVDDNGSLRDSIWLKTIGPEYIDMAFNWAHQADPQAQLFYNDYDNADLGTKSNAIYALLQGLLKRGVPVHGVGFQMHVNLDSPPRSADVAANMKRLADLGLKVQITEMDVRIQGAPTEGQLAAQAGIYHDTMQTCLSAKNCNAFVLWGFTDRYSWIPDAFPGYGSALIFDGSYAPKPAYTALLEALQGK